jgi:hypothetical protein
VPTALLSAALFNTNDFEPFSNARYLMPVVVVLLVAIAAFLGQLLGTGTGSRLPRRALLGLLAVGLSLQPLVALARFDENRPVDNRALVQALGVIESNLEPGEVLILDKQLFARRGGASVRDGVLDMLLTLRAVPYRYALVEPDDVRTLLARRPSQLAVLDGESVPRLRDRFSLTYLATLGARSSRTGGPEHALYRLAP